MKYGGLLNNSLLFNILLFENEREWMLFPEYHREIVDIYLKLIQRTKQFRIIKDSDNKIILYADYWLFNERNIDKFRFKQWNKPWPKDITSGDIAYCYFTWIDKAYRNTGLLNMIIRDFKNDLPYKLCYHVSQRNNRFRVIDKGE